MYSDENDAVLCVQQVYKSEEDTYFPDIYIIGCNWSNFYGFYFLQVCDRNRKPLNVNVKSEEEGVVGEVVGLGLSRGLPEAPASLPKQNATSS